MAPFSKPETVLRQAEGLVSVGQSHAALQLLTETFSSKRFRSTPLNSLEPIMFRFIELCVEMRKGRTVKEGLMQYKNIAQNVNAKSIEVVIIRLLGLADEKVKEAQQQAAVAVEIDDLEASETPESILLGAVSGDQNKDRTDRAVVTPWLRFLWESYRTSLETLKNNVRLEAIYQQIAQQAFKFCIKYSRKAEFRRLCETLRTHLTNAAKYSYQQHSINLSDPDTLQHHLDTRFAQLNASVELELWQEAFRSVEDVHNLLTMAKKAPRPAMMANYYEKLTKIFLVSGNALYHAAAWGKYHAIVTSIGGKSDGEMSRLAGKVLVSALAVPVGLQTEEVEGLKGRNARLSALLGLVRVPTRAGLLKDAFSRGILKLSPASIKSLYQVLEVTFDPLSLCSSIAPLFQTLSTDSAYSPYLPLLQRALLSRLLNQLSQVYSNVKIATLLELVQPLKFETTEEGEKSLFNAEGIEAYIMGCARRGELNIRVDHKDGSMTFINDAFAVSGDEFQSPAASSSSRGRSRESTIQPSLAENVHTRLSGIAYSLHNAILLLDGPKPSQEEKLKTLFVQVEAERKALQTKRALVARRRELLSELTVRKEKEESSRKAEIKAREKEEQTKRQREEARKREIELARKQIEAVRKDEAKKYAQTLVVKGILKANDIQKLDNYDTENLIGMQVAQLEKEKSQTNERLRITAKHMDHLERAYRKEEQPLLGQDYLDQQAQDKETFKVIKRERLETSKLAHAQDLETKARLLRMVEDHKTWKSVVEEKKKEAYKKKQEVARKKIDAEKEKRREQVMKAWEEEKGRREKEEEERRVKEEEEREREEARRAEEERLRLEEEARLAAEEAAFKKREEEAAAQRAQRDKERQEAMEQANFQRQREQEAEERRQQRRLEEAAAKASQSPFGSARGMPANRGTSATEMEWRRSSSGAGGPRSSAASAVEPPPRSGSPGPAKYKPGALSGGGGWRERERAKAEATANGASRGLGNGLLDKTSSPASQYKDRDRELRKDEDRFTTVTKTGAGSGVWRRGGGR